MKRNLILPAILVVILLANFYKVTFAQTSTSTVATSTENGSNNSMVSSTTPPTSAPAALSAVAQTRITNLCANLSNRMDGATSRLQNIIDRLNSRLTKMSESGTDVSSAKANLDEAQKKLDLAKANLKNIDIAVAAFIGSNNPSESWKDLKFTYLATRDAIIASHTLIMQSIQKTEIATTVIPVANTDNASNTSTSSKQ